MIPGSSFGSAGGAAVVALSTVAAVPAADVGLVAATDTLLATSPSLAVGTWLVSASAEYVLTGAVASDASLWLLAGTATCTFAGPQSADGELGALASGTLGLALSCLVSVTVAGTVQLRGRSVLAATAKKLDTGGVGLAVTGLTAVKIA